MSKETGHFVIAVLQVGSQALNDALGVDIFRIVGRWVLIVLMIPSAFTPSRSKDEVDSGYTVKDEFSIITGAGIAKSSDETTVCCGMDDANGCGKDSIPNDAATNAGLVPSFMTPTKKKNN